MNKLLLAAAIAAIVSSYVPVRADARPATVATNEYPGVLAALVDQDGRRFDATHLSGRLVLVNFIFTGCGSTCPVQTMALAKFFRSLPPAVRDRLMLISVSVDPAHDTPRVLKSYARQFGADRNQWRFLSGRPADIAKVTRTFAALRPGATDASFHTSELRLFDARGSMIQRYAGAPLAERQLRADLLALLGTA